MLNAISGIINIGFIYLLSLLLGYCILHLAKPERFLNLPFFVKLPLYLSIGLTSLTVITYLTGFFFISGYVLLIVGLFSLLIMVYLLSKSHTLYKQLKVLKSTDNLLFLLLFVFTFTYFITVISIFKWPPPGDVAVHGLYSSLIVNNQKIGFSLAPYAPSIPALPSVTGIHAISASLSLFTGVLPGEAVFLVGGGIAILIPLLLSSLVYLLTNSKLLSLLSFFSTFIIDSSLERWVFGYFYNGPYPCMFGFLCILLFITYYLLCGNKQLPDFSIQNKAVISLTTLSILVIYPNFILFPLSFLFFMLFPKIKIHKIKTIKFKNFLVFILSLLIFIVTCIIFKDFILQLLEGLIYYGSRAINNWSYDVSISFLYNSINGPVILFAGALCFIFILKRINLRLSIFYLLIFIPILFSLHPSLYKLFAIILPDRSIILCALISWAIISVFINYIFTRLNQKTIYFNFLTRLRFKSIKFNFLCKIIAVCSIIFILFSSSLIYTFNFTGAKNYSWLMRHGFENDYDVLYWAHENISSNELIINDYSFTSRFLLSFSLKNITSTYHLKSDFEINRAKDVQVFWSNPRNTSYLLELIDKYDPLYVLVTSERGYHNLPIIGGDGKYHQKPFTPATYKSIFQEIPFLELVFENGDAGIYKINVELIGDIVSETALQFDSGSYINIAHDESLNLTNEFTITVRINPFSLPKYDTFLISKLVDYELAWRWDRRISLFINNSIVVSSNKIFAENDLYKWWDITVTYNGSTACIYLNGKLDASQILSGTIATHKNPLSIACRNPDRPFGFFPTFIIDYLYVFNRSLSLSDSKIPIGDSLNNCVLLFSFDEGIGETVYDQSGNTNHGTIYGAQWIKFDKYLPRG